MTAPVAAPKAGQGAFVGLATWAVIHVIAAVLATNATGTVVLQALAAEVGAGRAGVMWTSPSSRGSPSRRIATGAIGGLAFALLLLGLGAASGAIHLASAGQSSASIATLLVGAAVSTAAAVRDELVLRGVVLRAFGGTISPALLLVALGLVAALSEPSLGPDAAFRFAAGVAFASVWQLDRGAFMACAANAVLRFATGTLVSGGAFNLRISPGAFAGPAGILSSAAAIALAAAFAGVLAFRQFGPKHSIHGSPDRD